MKEIRNSNDFDGIISEQETCYILFHTPSSTSAQQAFKNLEVAAEQSGCSHLWEINAAETPEVHRRFDINMVPALLIMQNGKKENIIFGEQTISQYTDILNDDLFITGDSTSGDDERTHSVTVYTSNGCPWCDRAKSHLKKNGINFREINVSSSPDEAQRLVKRTGQRGTPQINIDGTYIVGFDQKKIDRMLNIH